MEIQSWLKKVGPIVEKVWKFAKKHTALFLGMATAAVSVVTLAYNAIEHCYEVGYYQYGFNVSSSFLGMVQTTGISTDFVLGIVLTCFVAVYTLIGREAYRNRKFFKFFAKTVGVFLCFYILPFIISAISEPTWSNVVISLIAFSILAMFLSVILNMITFSYCISPTINDKLKRKRLKLSVVEARLATGSLRKRAEKRLSKDCDKLNCKIEKLEKEKCKRESEHEKR